MATNNAPVQGPVIDVPVNPKLATEPARTIGDLFADKTMIRPFIAAVIAIVAVTTGWVAADEVIDNLTTIVTTIAVVYGVWAAQRDASSRAREQAEMTRDVVYAPTTVHEVVREAAEAGTARIRDTVPESEWGVNRRHITGAIV